MVSLTFLLLSHSLAAGFDPAQDALYTKISELFRWKLWLASEHQNNFCFKKITKTPFKATFLNLLNKVHQALWLTFSFHVYSFYSPSNLQCYLIQLWKIGIRFALLYYTQLRAAAGCASLWELIVKLLVIFWALLMQPLLKVIVFETMLELYSEQR